MNLTVPDEVSSLTPRFSQDIDAFRIGDDKSVILTNTALNVENSTVHIGNVIHHHHIPFHPGGDSQAGDSGAPKDNGIDSEKAYTTNGVKTKYDFLLSNKRICFSITFIFTATLVTSAILLLVFIHQPRTSEEEDAKKDDDTDEDPIAKPSQTFNNLTDLDGCKIFEEEDWGMKRNLGDIELKHPVPLVIISHSATPICNSTKACKTRMKQMQYYHISKGSPDIGYNFMIGGDGNIYVGRGWNARNFHLGNHSIGINFVGNFFRDELTPKMIECAKKVMVFGANSKILEDDYKIVCHNQTNSQLLSPGPNVYAVVKEWPHFMEGEVSRGFLYGE